MTASTDQERAEFEKAWRERPIYMGGVHQKEVAYIWWTQAARRAQAVPQVSAAQIREIFLAHGFTIKEGLNDLKPYVYAAARALLAAAPQPPEAAPVVLPEPAAWVFKDRTWTEIRAMAVDHDGVPAYTEQQVRELLATHGIEVAP